MNIGVIGNSGHFNYIIESLKLFPQAKLCAYSPGNVNEDSTKIEKWFNDNNIQPEYYSNYKDLIKKNKIDIAFINPHFYLNAKICKAFLESNSHVILEKPLATNIEELKEIKESALKTKKLISLLLPLRFKPWFLTAKKYIDHGVIGKPVLITAQKSYKLGKRPSFYKSRKTFGGTIPWVGSHAIDWIRWMSGEEYVTVNALHSIKSNKNHGELESSALIQFRMTNQVMASVNIDYLRPGTSNSHGDDRLRIAGTMGVLEIRNEEVFIIDEKKGEYNPNLLEGKNIFSLFYEAVEKKKEPPVTFKDSYRITEVCLKARQAADTGKMVYL